MFSAVERGRWSTGQLLRRRIHQGDTDCNDVIQLLKQFSSFAFDRFGQWIGKSRSLHSKAADLPSFLLIGIGELRQGSHVGGSPGSSISLFLFVRQFIPISVQRLFG
jgi:hypothetical protein